VMMPLRQGDAAARGRGKLKWPGPSSMESGTSVPNTRKTRQGASAMKLVRRPCREARGGRGRRPCKWLGDHAERMKRQGSSAMNVG
jgi:hypothetical protein